MATTTTSGGSGAAPGPGPVAPFTVRDGLAVYRIGQGDPVLLVPAPHRFTRPGLPETDAMIGSLLALGRQVVTFDPPGSGHSTRPARLSEGELRDCADEALTACGIDVPVDAIGYSMAGLVLLGYALDRPTRVARLVLVGTGTGGTAYMKAPGALWNRSHPDFAGLAALGILHTLWPRRATETLLNNYIHRRSFVDRRLATRDPLTPGDWVRRRRGNPEWHRIAKRLDYAPRLGEIAVPTLVLCGTHDPQFPVSASRQLAEGIGGARSVFFERSGHFPFIEEPDAFWSEVRAFWQP